MRVQKTNDWFSGVKVFGHTLCIHPELHKTQDIEDNSKIIFLFLNKNICCDSSLEPSWSNGSNDGSQNMFLWRNLVNYPQITSVTPSYLEYWP